MSDNIKGYTPTTDEVRDGFRGNPKKYDEAGTPVERMGENYAVLNDMAFNRWLAAHDAEVRDKALTLTDDELAIAEGAYESYIMEYEGDGLGAMSIALKAVAENRRKQ